VPYRVDNLPGVLRPLVAVFGFLCAALLFCTWGLLRATLRVRHLGRPAALAGRPAIECAWHEALLPYFAVAMPYQKPHAWLNHPAWYMRGVHLFLGWMGVAPIVLGSSGHGGRQALEALVPLLAGGASTFLNPDGPHGPAREVKDGVLELSLRTGLPVVALHIRCRRALRLPTWERKVLPLPGSQVEVIYSQPLVVTERNREEARAALKRHLDGEAPAPS